MWTISQYIHVCVHMCCMRACIGFAVLLSTCSDRNQRRNRGGNDRNKEGENKGDGA